MEERSLGLSEREAARRLARDGKNELQKPKRKGVVRRFWEQLQDPLIYVLMVAAFVSILLKEYSDAAIIAAVVFLNACVGMIQEGKARKALEALEDLQSPMARVIREGKKRAIPASQLVLGDLVCIEAGDRVPADLRLIEAVDLMAEESALTGESLPVAKEAMGMAYASTMITAGRGRGVVHAVGMQTQIGRIAGMIHEEKDEMTPLQKRLGKLGTVLSLLSLLLCALLFGVAIWQKRDVMQMLLTAISLAVAVVPEGLPAVVTICLALSVSRLVKAGTIVRKLPSVETLGAVSVVCSDKTGTLTQNRVRAEMGYWDKSAKSLIRTTVNGIRKEVLPKEMLEAMVLCSEASLGSGGDATELALLELGRNHGVEKEALEREMPRVDEIPFSSASRQMTTFHLRKGRRIGFRKGAPDVILKDCTLRRLGDAYVPMEYQDRQEILRAVSEMAGMAYRTMAMAWKDPVVTRDAWAFLGFVAMGDPPRPEAANAVRLLKDAGVKTVMITGDHAQTALAIGRQLGIAERESQTITGDRMERWSEEELLSEMKRRDVRIFARVTPAQKVRIVKLFQRQGKIVAMTGDGVNDAPSLKAADIGIAMGKNGTDVAKEAADVILSDDNFATIERAIEEGRGIYENIRKSVIFLLSSNLGELLTMLIAVIMGSQAPLRSSHVLWINLITDSLPALALGVDRYDGRELMRHSPREAGESLFARGGLGCTCFYGILIAAISLFAFHLPTDLAEKQTFAFMVLGMSQLFHAIGMRNVNRSVFRENQLENKVMILALALGIALQAAVTEIPFLVKAFGTVSLSLAKWGEILALSVLPLVAHELILLFFGEREE